MERILMDGPNGPYSTGYSAGYKAGVESQTGEITRLNSEVARLRDALFLFANEDNWELFQDADSGKSVHCWNLDGWPSEKAFKALNKDGDNEWQPIETAPWQTIVEVRNSVMAKYNETAMGTRGYANKSGVSPHSSYFTGTDGTLIVATEWRPI
jgi:hypothetical protein